MTHIRSPRRRATVAAGAAILAATGLLGTTPAYATASSAATASGIVTLGGFCLEGGAGSGKPVTIASCSGGASQLWKWHTNGELTSGSQCLEITGGSNATGALAEPAACDDSAGHLPPARPVFPRLEPAVTGPVSSHRPGHRADTAETGRRAAGSGRIAARTESGSR